MNVYDVSIFTSFVNKFNFPSYSLTGFVINYLFEKNICFTIESFYACVPCSLH